MSHFLRNCGRGALAGLVATVPMTALMIAVHRRLPWFERYQFPPEKITGELADALDLEVVQTEPVRTIATAVAHLGYGAGAGSVYGGTAGERASSIAPVGAARRLLACTFRTQTRETLAIPALRLSRSRA
jgi:hypothetical protein